MIACTSRTAKRLNWKFEDFDNIRNTNLPGSMDILKKAAVNLSRFVATQSLMVATRNDISCQYMKYYIYNDAYVLAYLSMQTFDIMYKMNCKETLQKKLLELITGIFNKTFLFRPISIKFSNKSFSSYFSTAW